MKGFGLAVKAFSEFVSRNPNCTLSIVGSGPDEDNLKTIVRQAQLESKVRFLGWMTRGDLQSEMASCDIFLFPSLRDGGGGVVIEAMAAGKPVVCLNISGPGMHVTNECGIKVDPGPPEKVVRDLAEALEHLYNNGELRRKLGDAARERVRSEYHWDKLGNRLMGYYKLSCSSKSVDRIN